MFKQFYNISISKKFRTKMFWKFHYSWIVYILSTFAFSYKIKYIWNISYVFKNFEYHAISRVFECQYFCDFNNSNTTVLQTLIFKFEFFYIPIFCFSVFFQFQYFEFEYFSALENLIFNKFVMWINLISIFRVRIIFEC